MFTFYVVIHLHYELHHARCHFLHTKMNNKLMKSQSFETFSTSKNTTHATHVPCQDQSLLFFICVWLTKSGSKVQSHLKVKQESLTVWFTGTLTYWQLLIKRNKMNIIIQKLTSPMATSFSWYFSINGNASSKSFKKEKILDTLCCIELLTFQFALVIKLYVLWLIEAISYRQEIFSLDKFWFREWAQNTFKPLVWHLLHQNISIINDFMKGYEKLIIFIKSLIFNIF